MQQLTMKLGELRRPKLQVTSSAGGTFTITDPSYKLLLGGAEVASGVPEVDEHTLTVAIEPEQTGDYILEFTFWIAGERLIRRVLVAVRE